MANGHYSTKIDLDLMGELARRPDKMVRRGMVGSKPETTSQALTDYFELAEIRGLWLQLWARATTFFLTIG